MYEENRRFSWTNLFIKIIIVVIFILFTIWLLSLATKNATREVTKGMSDSINVLTDNIYAQNMDRMKEVGRSYFTTERLPEKVGDVKTLSLAKMYDEGLILEVKDKHGNACSAKNSYVSVEKMENEYQMKVYLECGEEKDSIKVIMGCYNYCDTDICERKQGVKGIEYEYSKTTGGSYGPWGNWTNWSKTAVSKTNYRDVETKVVREDYSYDKKTTKSTFIENAVCPTVDGYTFKGMTNGVCSYARVIVDTKGPNTCPQKSGDYTLVSQDGFNCNYTKKAYGTTNPSACAKTTSDGYELVSQNGFTCNYSKTVKGTTNPNKCASTYNGYSLTSQNGFTCNYSKPVTSTVSATKTQAYTQSCRNVVVDTKTVWDCSSTCKQVIQNVTEYRCTSVPNGYTYSCSSGTLSGTDCIISSTATTTTTVGCPSGYTKSGNTCVANNGTTSTKTTTVNCPSGYTKSGSSCISNTATTVSKTTKVTCPSGYEVRGTSCAKDVTYKHNEDSLCDDGLRQSGGKCYKDETITERVTDVRNVTYYRYRLRDYTGGTTDYKWSKSDKDQSLLNAGYRLTGKTRNIGGK
ncbi:MAG: hypothetical protein IKI04_03105 [Bacilli bacterium]|nr:hypothetical protein [Bacilli bacterium]